MSQYRYQFRKIAPSFSERVKNFLTVLLILSIPLDSNYYLYPGKFHQGFTSGISISLVDILLFFMYWIWFLWEKKEKLYWPKASRPAWPTVRKSVKPYCRRGEKSIESPRCRYRFLHALHGLRGSVPRGFCPK